MQYNTQPLVAALPAVVGIPATRTAERLSELSSQTLSVSVHASMSVTLYFSRAEVDAMRKTLPLYVSDQPKPVSVTVCTARA